MKNSWSQVGDEVVGQDSLQAWGFRGRSLVFQAQLDSRGWYLLLLSPLLGDPPLLSAPHLPPDPVSEHRRPGCCFSSCTWETTVQRCRMSRVTQHTQLTGPGSDLPSPLPVRGLVRRLAQRLPPSFRLSCPSPDFQEPQFLPDRWGRLGPPPPCRQRRGHRPGHYVMIR